MGLVIRITASGVITLADLEAAIKAMKDASMDYLGDATVELAAGVLTVCNERTYA